MGGPPDACCALMPRPSPPTAPRARASPHLNVHRGRNPCATPDLCEVIGMIRLKVNGSERSFDGDPQMPLLWYLRDELGLVGAKFGCGVGLCGACTVHQNGKAVRACVVAMSAAAGSEIITIEGISARGLHPVQKAWIDFNVPQCGYCQAGQIMQAAALLASNRKPSDSDIDRAMAGNICRCGTYQRIRAAIKAAAEESA